MTMTKEMELVEKTLNRSPVLRSGYPNVVSVPETEWLALRDYIRSLRCIQAKFGSAEGTDLHLKHRETYGE